MKIYFKNKNRAEEILTRKVVSKIHKEAYKGIRDYTIKNNALPFDFTTSQGYNLKLTFAHNINRVFTYIIVLEDVS